MPTLEKLRKSKNIAELLDDSKLSEIAQSVHRGYEIDEESRKDWLKIVKEALEIANLTMEEKDFPWPGASNIKFPLIAMASLNYAARVTPELIQGDKLVKIALIGNDPDGKKQERDNRVSTYMSWQLLSSPDWKDSMDKLLQVLPVLGTVFKKTYWDDFENRCCSELCVPDRIVVNYNTQSLETARRVTHILQFYKNDIIERIRKGLYSDIDVELLQRPNGESWEDQDPRLDILEQHCWLDLDEDGYKEPYVVTQHKESKQILRIINRINKIEKNKKNEIMRIEADQYFTDYHFIRSMDGGFYSQGFGSLLLPINKSINSTINQLTDAGTLANTQGGFYSSRLRTKAGELRSKMGVFQKMDAHGGEKLSDSFFQYPFKEPSQTLLALLNVLIDIGSKFASITDVMSGNQPAQNVASHTVSQLIDQGSKTLTSINQRVYNSWSKELKKIYICNYYYLNQNDYVNVIDDSKADVKADFDLDSMDIIPVADPTISSDHQRLQRAMMIMQLQTVDHEEATRLILQSLQLDSGEIQKLLPPKDPNAPPSPEVQKIMSETQLNQAKVGKISADATLSAEVNQINKIKLQSELKWTEAQVNESAGRVWSMQQDQLHKHTKDAITSTKMQSQEQLKSVDIAAKVQKQHHEQSMSELELGHKITTDNAELYLDNKKIEAEKQRTAAENSENDA